GGPKSICRPKLVHAAARQLCRSHAHHFRPGHPHVSQSSLFETGDPVEHEIFRGDRPATEQRTVALLRPLYPHDFVLFLFLGGHHEANGIAPVDAALRRFLEERPHSRPLLKSRPLAAEMDSNWTRSRRATCRRAKRRSSDPCCRVRDRTTGPRSCRPGGTVY